ncbi:MYND Zn-finger protein [Rhizoctonia solani]|uniref:MYND Zn-finger protein n=1 Tax=Rhizoctonia solani TaxID=456999 RepID=A0A8H8P389_9AGAM|nr:MYND Zn-finger protein [Rhizoctonia solani]QRW24350.1 MYND Zn-finger protein [Rhizoctonia solani]
MTTMTDNPEPKGKGISSRFSNILRRSTCSTSDSTGIHEHDIASEYPTVRKVIKKPKNNDSNNSISIYASDDSDKKPRKIANIPNRKPLYKNLFSAIPSGGTQEAVASTLAETLRGPENLGSAPGLAFVGEHSGAFVPLVASPPRSPVVANAGITLVISSSQESEQVRDAGAALAQLTEYTLDNDKFPSLPRSTQDETEAISRPGSTTPTRNRTRPTERQVTAMADWVFSSQELYWFKRLKAGGYPDNEALERCIKYYTITNKAFANIIENRQLYDDTEEETSSTNAFIQKIEKLGNQITTIAENALYNCTQAAPSRPESPMKQDEEEEEDTYMNKPEHGPYQPNPLTTEITWGANAKPGERISNPNPPPALALAPTTDPTQTMLQAILSKMGELDNIRSCLDKLEGKSPQVHTAQTSTPRPRPTPNSNPAATANPSQTRPSFANVTARAPAKAPEVGASNIAAAIKRGIAKPAPAQSNNKFFVVCFKTQSVTQPNPQSIFVAMRECLDAANRNLGKGHHSVMLDCNFAVTAGLAASQEGPIPYIPTPGTPFPYQIDPLAARTFSLAFQCVVNIGVRGSEHIRRGVVQAGGLGVVSCILAVWLKGKGFAIGPSATGSGAPRESREVHVRRREEALERQRALDLPRALKHATSSDNLRARAIAQPQPRIATTTDPPPALPPVRTNTYPKPSSEEADEDMSGASNMGPSPTPPPPAIGRSMSNDSDGGYVGVPSLPAPSGPSGAFAAPRGPHAHSFDIRTASPIPIASTSPVMGRAISPNTAQSSDASANVTPVGSGTPTGSVVVPGRDRSGTVVGRPIWDNEGGPRQVAQPFARPTWSDADETSTREVTTTGRRGTITRRPRRERDTDGDDTEADGDDQTAQQGERRTIGIVDAADGDGAMAMDMMGEGIGVGVVALEQNDDLAMGAPPGALGAIGTPRARVAPGTEPTPRAGIATLGAQIDQTAQETPFYETPATLRALVDASNEPKPSAQPLSSAAQSPNVFSLVERFTFRPSPSETTLPRLPHEIQYWAGAKYCGKECQSKAWAEGHRFWCSACEEEDSQTVVACTGSFANTVPPAAVATEVKVPTRRGLTNTVTRALVNITGGMTGRTNTTVQQPQAQPVPTNSPTASAFLENLMRSRYLIIDKKRRRFLTIT